MDASFSLSAVEDFLQQTQIDIDDQQADMAAVALPSIKIEEHVAPSTITPDLLSLASPEPTSSSSRHPKKRKSWGQVLPEPTTTLPPRKRAKTADEKEQRRIERVKRNRLAAHNSRERKREEMEQLQVVNDGLVAQMEAMREHMKAMVAEITALRGGSSSASIPSSVTSFDFTTITKHESYQQAPSSMASPPMTATTSALQTPELGNLDSPDMEILDEFPATPMEDGFGGEDLSDPTQQSAALLCDLQCRSQRSLSCHNSSGQPIPSQSPSNSYHQQLLLTALITFQLNLQIFLSSVSTLSSTSTVTTLARKLFTATATTPGSPTSSSTSPLPSLLSMIYWTTALARQATSSTSSQPTKAHLQKVATGLAAKLRMELTPSSSPRRSSSHEARGSGAVAARSRRPGGAESRRRSKGPKRSRARRRIVMTWDVKSAISGVAGVRGADSRLRVALQKLGERSVWR